MKLGFEDYDKDWWIVQATPMNSYNRDISEWQPVYEWISARISGRVLDMGCGMGHLARELRKHNIGVVGVDFSRVALVAARRKVPGVNFIFDDIETTPLIEQGNYDSICFTEVLEHIEGDIEIIKRVPKGKAVFISVPKQKPQDHPQHVHFFSSKKEVKQRYRSFLQIKEIEVVSEYQFICLYGIRK